MRAQSAAHQCSGAARMCATAAMPGTTAPDMTPCPRNALVAEQHSCAAMTAPLTPAGMGRPSRTHHQLCLCGNALRCHQGHTRRGAKPRTAHTQARTSRAPNNVCVRGREPPAHHRQSAQPKQAKNRHEALHLHIVVVVVGVVIEVVVVVQVVIALLEQLLRHL